MKDFLLNTDNEAAFRAAESVYKKWDDALKHKDLDASMAVYAEDCTLESPLVRNLLGTEEGVIEGRGNLRKFVETVFRFANTTAWDSSPTAPS